LRWEGGGALGATELQRVDLGEGRSVKLYTPSDVIDVGKEHETTSRHVIDTHFEVWSLEISSCQQCLPGNCPSPPRHPTHTEFWFIEWNAVL
jgi:hypothetical protein